MVTGWADLGLYRCSEVEGALCGMYIGKAILLRSIIPSFTDIESDPGTSVTPVARIGTRVDHLF